MTNKVEFVSDFGRRLQRTDGGRKRVFGFCGSYGLFQIVKAFARFEGLWEKRRFSEKWQIALERVK